MGYLVYDHFGVKKRSKTHFDHKLHLMSHRLIISEVHNSIDYECPDYSSYNMNLINSDIQLRHAIQVLQRYTEYIIYTNKHVLNFGIL